MLCCCVSPHNQVWRELLCRATAGIPSRILMSSRLVSHQREFCDPDYRLVIRNKSLSNCGSSRIRCLRPVSDGMVLLEKRLANRFSNNTIGYSVCQALASRKFGSMGRFQPEHYLYLTEEGMIGTA